MSNLKVDPIDRNDPTETQRDLLIRMLEGVSGKTHKELLEEAKAHKFTKSDESKNTP